MTTIKVDAEFVRELAGRLRRVKDAFERLDDDTERYASESVTGDDRVTAQLLEFGRNWFDRRVEMAKQMEELAGHLDGAAGAYVETDRGLARPYDRAHDRAGGAW
jgi:hypothetical protein